jgi:hypothetical protein
MKSLARACLRVLMLGIPVVIAACYGPPSVHPRPDAVADRGRRGKVVDKYTRKGIASVEVACVLANGDLGVRDRTDAEGDFLLSPDGRGCPRVLAREQSDTHAPVTVPFPEADGAVIEMVGPQGR